LPKLTSSLCPSETTHEAASSGSVETGELAMVRYTTRSELESQAKRLGYEPDRDDTDADLVLAINVRLSGTGRSSMGDDEANSHAVFPPHATARGS
jgi:hypothetical protein